MANTVIIGEDDSGQRFDKFLIRRFKTGGKGFVYKMIRKKRVKLNGKRAFGDEILMAGDTVTLYISPETQAELGVKAVSPVNESLLNRTLNILYEDKHVIIVNKPADMLTHPDLVVMANLHVGDEAAFRPAAVNRLDRNTTGIVIIAKTLTAARELSEAIRERSTRKFYLTAVYGSVDGPMTITSGYKKDRLSNKAIIGQESEGKEAVTNIRPVSSAGGISILEVQLITGRSHQIRAHLQSIGAPVIGDPKYGDPAVNRRYGVNNQLLHAWKIVFTGLKDNLSYLNGKTFICEPEGELLRIMKSI